MYVCMCACMLGTLFSSCTLLQTIRHIIVVADGNEWMYCTCTMYMPFDGCSLAACSDSCAP